VIMRGLKLALLGSVIGMGASFLLLRFMSTLLVGVTATDPLTLMLVSVILMAVAAIACFVPATRATKVDPLEALRSE